MVTRSGKRQFGNRTRGNAPLLASLLVAHHPYPYLRHPSSVAAAAELDLRRSSVLLVDPAPSPFVGQTISYPRLQPPLALLLSFEMGIAGHLPVVILMVMMIMMAPSLQPRLPLTSSEPALQLLRTREPHGRSMIPCRDSFTHDRAAGKK